jgi:hypothetical protein
MSSVALGQASDDRKLVRWGWVTAVLVQPVGVVLGVVLPVRGSYKHGAVILLVAAVTLASLLYVAGVFGGSDARQCSHLVQGLCDPAR